MTTGGHRIRHYTVLCEPCLLSLYSWPTRPLVHVMIFPLLCLTLCTRSSVMAQDLTGYVLMSVSRYAFLKDESCLMLHQANKAQGQGTSRAWTELCANESLNVAPGNKHIS